MVASAWVPLYTALVAGTFAVITSLVTVIGIFITSRLTIQRDVASEGRKQEQQKKDRLAAVLSRFRSPLMLATSVLHGRLDGILWRNFGNLYAYGTPAEKAYAVKSTAFLFGQFFAWREILLREVQFLDLGTVPEQQEVQQHFDELRTAFSAYEPRPPFDSKLFRLYGEEQRAFGQTLIVEFKKDDHTLSGCMGYAQFLRGDSASEWCESIETSFKAYIDDQEGHERAKAAARLEVIYKALGNLMDILDPDYAYHVNWAHVKQHGH